MINKLGLQLYTVRDLLKTPESADETFAKLAKMGYVEAQTAGNAFDAKLFGELAKKNGVKIIGTHYSWDEILNNTKDAIEVHRAWGTTNMGIGIMPGPARTDLGELKKFIADFNRMAKIVAEEGFRLTYHNHHFEYVRIDGYKTIMDIMYEELDPKNTSFVLDTCWVASGGGDVNAWMEKLAGRLDILHLKDVTVVRDENGKIGPTMTEIGHGNLDWDSIIKTAQKIGVKHYVVEQDKNFMNESPLESLQFSADYLKKYRA